MARDLVFNVLPPPAAIVAAPVALTVRTLRFCFDMKLVVLPLTLIVRFAAAALPALLIIERMPALTFRVAPAPWVCAPEMAIAPAPSLLIVRPAALWIVDP